MKRSIILLICMIVLASCQGIYEIQRTGFPQYGVPSGANNFPDATERMTDLWINMARVAPINWRNDYMMPLMSDQTGNNVYATGTYTPQAPYYWNLNLNRAARAHSFDVSVNCADQLTHNDCNGTSAGVRNARFGTSNSSSSWSGENFVNQNQLSPFKFPCNNYKFWPLLSTGAFICDGTYGTTCKIQGCKVDGSGDGHRANIMSKSAKQYASGNIWVGLYGIQTHEFSSSVTPYTDIPYITTGSHFWHDTSNENVYKYAAIINTGSLSVKNVKLFVNGASETLSFYGGLNTSVGVYASGAKTFTGCDKYYFVLSYNNTYTYRYPQKGVFRITNNATCTTNWEDSNSSSLVTVSKSLCVLLALFLALFL